ncbi:hypothetical protein [Edaphobacter flagellatus]|uniref:hypothetical protein n=1 Tax=Edaphobacter flagellatus TaxID=1933044 RepID=UPI0021B290D4|nr:hypothetical protein [Edaphobacter flagellatus]
MLAFQRMTTEQKKFLEGRYREAVAEQPELKPLKALLLRFGGIFLVAPPKPDPDITLLLESGFLMHGRVVTKPMRSSMCHQNVAAVWKRRKPRIVGIATGYALTEDGLWRQHSWGILRDGMLETTCEREKYFGVLLRGAEADHFAESNPY